MTEAIAWLSANWFSLVQSAGIIISILLTAAAMRRERRSRRVGDYLALASEHRELWGDLHRRPELARVVASEVDLLEQPLSTAEEEFLLLIIVHFHTGWLLACQDSLVSRAVLARDAGAFFRLPLASEVWKRTQAARDPAFVEFINSACAKPKRRRPWPRLIFRRVRRRTKHAAMTCWKTTLRCADWVVAKGRARVTKAISLAVAFWAIVRRRWRALRSEF